MRTRLAENLRNTADGEEARKIIGSCVHCGFCLATCPTYQLLGDELDSPRGRIYLIKQVLEGSRPTALTQQHLDRCLTCRACETACPSGVQYGHLVDIGRALVAERSGRAPLALLARVLLRIGLRGRWFAGALRVGRAFRGALPKSVARRIPPRVKAGPWPARSHARRMLLPLGCVQPALAPRIDAATARVFDALGIELVVEKGAGCCGALPFHLDDPQGAREIARRNIDAWWPRLESGAEAIVLNASGCGIMIHDYGRLLKDDPEYAWRAKRVSERARDVAEVLAECAAQLKDRMVDRPAERVVFHPPCTLQHGLQIRGTVEAVIASLGAGIMPVAHGQPCCGSAGAYSILQPRLASALRDRKVAALLAERPDVILSANVGCIAHLAAGSPVPVRHWIEWVDERIAP